MESVVIEDVWARLFLILQTVLLLTAVTVAVLNRLITAMILGIATAAGGIALGVFAMHAFTIAEVEAWYGGILIFFSLPFGAWIAFDSAAELL